MNKKTNSKKTLVIVAVALSIVLALLVAVLVGMQFLPKLMEDTEQETGETVPTIPDLTISTPFCDLAFPGQWEERLRTEYTEYDAGGVVTFYGQFENKETELFSVRFSTDPSNVTDPLGALSGGESPVVVSLIFHEPEREGWTSEELEIVAAMAEDCNYLLDQLSAQPDFYRDYESLFAPNHIQIETPFCPLSLPGKWTDRIWWEFTPAETGGCLNVYGIVALEDAPLYTLCFGTETDSSIPVGNLKIGAGQIKISLEMAEPEDTGDWTSADWDEYSAMQETVNDLMAELSTNPDYTAL